MHRQQTLLVFPHPASKRLRAQFCVWCYTFLVNVSSTASNISRRHSTWWYRSTACLISSVNAHDIISKHFRILCTVTSFYLELIDSWLSIKFCWHLAVHKARQVGETTVIIGIEIPNCGFTLGSLNVALYNTAYAVVVHNGSIHAGEYSTRLAQPHSLFVVIVIVYYKVAFTHVWYVQLGWTTANMIRVSLRVCMVDRTVLGRFAYCVDATLLSNVLRWRLGDAFDGMLSVNWLACYLND